MLISFPGAGFSPNEVGLGWSRRYDEKGICQEGVRNESSKRISLRIAEVSDVLPLRELGRVVVAEEIARVQVDPTF